MLVHHSLKGSTLSVCSPAVKTTRFKDYGEVILLSEYPRGEKGDDFIGEEDYGHVVRAISKYFFLITSLQYIIKPTLGLCIRLSKKKGVSAPCCRIYHVQTIRIAINQQLRPR